MFRKQLHMTTSPWLLHYGLKNLSDIAKINIYMRLNRQLSDGDQKIGFKPQGIIRV